MEPNKQPHELRQEHLERERLQDIQRELRHRALVRRWTWSGAVIGLAMSVLNYLDVNYACIAHMLYSGLASYLLLRYKRGHLTGMALFGFGNEIISVVAGFFNPFGLLGFCVGGALVGIGMRIEENR